MPAIMKGIVNSTAISEPSFLRMPRRVNRSFMAPQATAKAMPHQIDNAPTARRPIRLSSAGRNQAAIVKPAAETSAPLQNQPRFRMKTLPSYSPANAFSSALRRARTVT